MDLLITFQSRRLFQVTSLAPQIQVRAAIMRHMPHQAHKATSKPTPTPAIILGEAQDPRQVKKLYRSAGHVQRQCLQRDIQNSLHIQAH